MIIGLKLFSLLKLTNSSVGGAQKLSKETFPSVTSIANPISF